MFFSSPTISGYCRRLKHVVLFRNVLRVIFTIIFFFLGSKFFNIFKLRNQTILLGYRLAYLLTGLFGPIMEWSWKIRNSNSRIFYKCSLDFLGSFVSQSRQSRQSLQSRQSRHSVHQNLQSSSQPSPGSGLVYIKSEHSLTSKISTSALV